MSKLAAAMIVRDEEAVLGRCFESLWSHVSKVVVNDNGSTDATPSIIEAAGNKVVSVPGAWIDFATNRNMALNVARQWADFILCGIDADEELVNPHGEHLQSYVTHVPADAFTIDVVLGTLRYPRVAVVRADFPWEWRYPVQEGLYPKNGATPVIKHIPGVYIRSHRDGARSKDPKTQSKDLELLKRFVEENPDDHRMSFYLAQQYRDMHLLFDAALAYARRASMGGYDQEVWYSQYMIARITEWQKDDPTRAYLKAFADAPTPRAEPLYHAAEYCRHRGLLHEAFIYANAAGMIEKPNGALFVEADVYDWKILDCIATVAYYTPFAKLGREAAVMLVHKLDMVPSAHHARILKNAEFYARM